MRKHKRITMALLLGLLLCLLLPTTALAAYSGSCGDNISYSLNEGTGELHIYGSGAMYDYSYDYGSGTNNGPWSSWADKIKSIRVTVASNSSDQITWLGQAAFANLPNLTTVNIYTHNTSLGAYCFRGCTSLTHFHIVDGVDIGDYAFYGCSALQYVNLQYVNGSTDYGSTYNRIGSYAFTGTGLTEISIPPYCKTFGTRALGYTTGTTKVAGFKIKSLTGCPAYDYAVTNGFSFANGWVPLIVSEPEEEWADLGQEVTFTVEAWGGETYRWYSYLDDPSDRRLEGTDGPELTVTATVDSANRNYYCEVSNSVNSSFARESSAAMLYVDLTPHILDGNHIAGGFVGDTAKFTVTAEGPDLHYQWYYSTQGSGGPWTESPLASAKSATLKVPVTAGRDGYFYYCKVYNDYGEVPTDPALLVVLEDLGTLEIDLRGDGTVLDYESDEEWAGVMLEQAAAIGLIEAINSSYPLNYDLDKVGRGDIYLEQEDYGIRYYTDADYTNLSGYYTLNSTAALRQAILNDRDGITPTALYSAIKFNFGTPLRFNVQPQDVAVAAGKNATFHVEAQGEGLTYTWQKINYDNDSYAAASSYTGYKTDTLTVPANDNTDGLLFRCLIRDSYGNTEVSNEVMLTVVDSPGTYQLDLRSGSVELSGEDADLIYGALHYGAKAGDISSGSDDDHELYDLDKNGTYDIGLLWNYDDDEILVISAMDTCSFSSIDVNFTSLYPNTYAYSCLRVLVGNDLHITGNPTDFYGKEGSTINFTVQAVGDGLTYQWWYKKADGTSFSKSTVAAAKKATFTMAMAEKYDGWQYYCIVTDQFGQTAKSSTVTIHYATPLRIVTQPADYTGRVGSTVKFTVAAEGEGLTYQWYYSKGDKIFNPSTLASGKKATYSMTLAEKHDGWMYYCIVTDKYGNTARTHIVRITVDDSVGIITQPQDFYGKVGDTISFSVGAVGNGLTYQWWYSKDGGVTFDKSTLASGKTATFTMTMAEKYDGWQYYCIVTDATGKTARSDTVTVHLGSPLKITTQPVDYTGAVGSTVTFKVVASGDGLTYQWYYAKGPNQSFSPSTLASGKKATYSMTMAEKHVGWCYYCVVSDQYGHTVTSKTVSIKKAPALTITGQPANFVGQAGDSITFKVTASGEGLSYQWWYKKTGASSFVKSTLASGTKATFTMTMADKYDGWKYYCIVTDKYGQTAQSNTVTITKGTPLKITTQPKSYVGAAGSTISLKVVAQGDGLTYQWWFRRANENTFNKSTVSAATKATFTMTMADKYDGWEYYCVVKDSHGNSVTSNHVFIYVGTPLKITSQPTSFSGAAGSPIKLTVAAQGDGLTYQWWYKKTGATSFVKSTLASGTKATFTMTMADKYDGWKYYCVVTDSHGITAKTNTVTITKK